MWKYAAIGGGAFAGCLGYAYISTGMQGLQYANPVRADGKVVIVTGANSGIGLETSRALVKRGAKVYMACRDLTKCEAAREDIMESSNRDHVYCLQCDLSSQASIRQFVKRFRQEEKRLDILVNNAGVMGCPQSATTEGIEMHFGVNHIGHFLLTNLLLDLLKQSAPSRVVVVSSLTHMMGQIKVADLNSTQSYDPLEAYNQSKLANMLFVTELSKRLENTGVTVNAVHPGFVDTQITRHLGSSRDVFRVFYGSPKSGAQTSLLACLEPALANVTGHFFSNCAVSNASEAAKDEDVAAWLWKVSEKWTETVNS